MNNHPVTYPYAKVIKSALFKFFWQLLALALIIFLLQEVARAATSSYITAEAAQKNNPNAWKITNTTRNLIISDVMGTHRIVGEYGAVQLRQGHPLTAGSGHLYLAGVVDPDATGETGSTRPILIIHRHDIPYVTEFQPLNGPGYLYLEHGVVNGNILMNPSTIKDSTATLSTSYPYGKTVSAGDVIINGNIDVAPGATGISNLIAADNTPLEIDGDIGSNGIPLTNVSASGADITLFQYGDNTGSINAQNLSATNSHSIKAGNHVIYGPDPAHPEVGGKIEWSGSVSTDKITIDNGSVVQGKAITVNNPIGGTSSGAGSMTGSAQLSSHGDDVRLMGGVLAASGTISSTDGGSIVAANKNGVYQPLNQGSGSLAISSDANVQAGAITVNSVSAANGNITASSAGASTPDGKGNITANTVAAPKGSVSANNLTLPLKNGATSSLKADSVTLAGNLNLTGGSLDIGGQNPSVIAGDVTVINGQGGLGAMTIKGTLTSKNSDLSSGQGDLTLNKFVLDATTLTGKNLYVTEPLTASQLLNNSSINSNSGNVYLRGGVDGASGSITATAKTPNTPLTASGNIIAQTEAGAWRDINQESGKLSLAAENNIEAGNITATNLKSGKDTLVQGSLNLTGSGQNSVGGNLALNNNASSALGDITVGGAITATGGTVKSGALSAQSAIFNKTSLDTDSLNVAGNFNMTQSSLALGQGPNTVGGNLVLQDSRQASLGDITLNGELDAGGGSVSGGEVNAKNATFQNGVSASFTSLAGNLAASDGAIVKASKSLNGQILSVASKAIVNAPDITYANINGASDGLITADTVGSAQSRINMNGANIDAKAINAASLIAGDDASIKANAGNIASINTSGVSSLVIPSLTGLTLTASGGSHVRSDTLLQVDQINASGTASITAPNIEGKMLDISGNSAVNSANVSVEELSATGGATLKAETVNSRAVIDLFGGSSLFATNVTTGGLSIFENSQLIATGTVSADYASVGPDSTLFAKSIEVDTWETKEGKVEVTDNLIIHKPIDADNMLGNSVIDARGVILQGGVKQAEGIIETGDDGFILAGSNFGGPYEDILQGAGHKLMLDSGGSIYANNIDVDSVASRNGSIDTRSVSDAGSITSPSISAPEGAIRTGLLVSEGTASKPAQVTASFLNADSVKINSGSLKLTGDALSVIDNDISLVNSKGSQFNSLSVGQEAFFSGGDISGKSLRSNNVVFTDGAQAAIDTISLAGETPGSLAVTNAATAASPTRVSLDSLRFNPGSILVSSASGQEAANLAVVKFGRSGDSADLQGSDSTLNGSLSIGANSLFTVGAKDNSWLASLVAASGPVATASEAAVMGVAAPIRLGAGGGIYLTNSPLQGPAALQNQIYFNTGTLLAIDGSQRGVSYQGNQINTADLPDSLPGAISAVAPVEARIAPGAKIYIKGVKSGYTYIALGKNITTIYDSGASRSAGDGWQGANLYTDNPLVKLERLENGKEGQFGVVRQELPPDIDPGHDPIISPPAPPTPPGPDEPVEPDPNDPITPGPDEPVEPGPNEPIQPGPNEPVEPGPNEPVNPGPNEPVNPGPSEPVEPEPIEPIEPIQPVKPLPPVPSNPFLNQALWHAQDYPKQAARVIEGGLRMAATGGVAQLSRLANVAASDAALSLRSNLSLDAAKTDSIELHPNFALWAVPLYRSLASSDMEAGGLSYDFNGALGGIVIGGDTTIANQLRLGVMFDLGGGFAQSAGDLDQTKNNMSFWGTGIYGIWWKGPLTLSGDLTFTSTYNKITRDLPSGMIWSSLKSDMTAQSIGASLKAAYNFRTDFLDIAPHVGGHYYRLNLNSYDIKLSGGPDVIHGDFASQDVWTFPLGIAFSRQFEFANGWRLLPSLDATVIPVAGDRRLNTTVSYTGMAGNLDLDTQIFDDITYGGSAGVELQAGDLTLGINYKGQFGQRSASQGIFGLIRYEF